MKAHQYKPVLVVTETGMHAAAGCSCGWEGRVPTDWETAKDVWQREHVRAQNAEPPH